MVFTTRVAMVALIISDGGGSVAKVEVVDEGLDVGSFLGLVEREGGAQAQRSMMVSLTMGMGKRRSHLVIE